VCSGALQGGKEISACSGGFSEPCLYNAECALRPAMNLGHQEAQSISSRAVAVSAYLLVEGMYLQNKTGLIPEFVRFYLKLLDEIKNNLNLLSKFREPTNRTILEEFQKYISQASVEPYAIKRRDQFLEKAFEHYLNSKTKGKIIGSK
jgi:hypothetical protein